MIVGHLAGVGATAVATYVTFICHVCQDPDEHKAQKPNEQSLNGVPGLVVENTIFDLDIIDVYDPS